MSNHANIAAAAEDKVLLMAAAQITATIEKEWLDLIDNAEAPNPFFAPWFLEPAMSFLDTKNKVQLCVIRRGEEMIGLAPVTMESTYAKIPLKHYSIWKHDHCYNGAPLIRRGCGAHFYSALFDWINSQPNGARFIRFVQCPFSKDLEQKLSVYNKQNAPRLRVQHSHERAILTHQQNFEAHMATVYSGKKRKELRRQAKRFEELGVVSFEHPPVYEKSLEDFIRLENAGWKSDYIDGFPIARNDATRSFFKKSMRAGAEQGCVTCLSLNLNGNPVAMLFSLHAGAHKYAFKTTYDEKYAAYSPGTRLIIEATRQMLNDPTISLFDSCARAGHPVVDSLWPERLRVTQFNVSASNAMDRNLLSLAAGLESLKINLTQYFRR